MLKIFIWSVVILNGLIWLGNWALTKSEDKSGSGMVLMFTVPLGIVVGLVSLVFIGFAT